jgi:hypothetical protein
MAPLKGKSMATGQVEVVLRLHEDTTNVIAAGKVQRWEVVKWVVTANVALATVSTASIFDSVSRFFILCFAAVVSGLGFWLLVHSLA